MGGIAFEALLNRNSGLCDHVVAEDEEIDILEKQVDQEAVSLLIQFHLVASDMREVISAMNVSTNLERVADQSVTIARRAKHLNNRPAVRELALLEPAYRLAVAIFRDSMRAFADADYELARKLKLNDRGLAFVDVLLLQGAPTARFSASFAPTKVRKAEKRRGSLPKTFCVTEMRLRAPPIMEAIQAPILGAWIVSCPPRRPHVKRCAGAI
jgi:hypothetical protein